MRTAFPYLGYDTPALRQFCEELGAEVVLPPATSRRTLELGVMSSPELICLPFKITLGNLLEAARGGADTLFMAAGARKCRFGYYHFLQDRILREQGATCRLVPVGQYSPYAFFFRLMPSVFGRTPIRVIRAMTMMFVKSILTREFRQLLNRKRSVDFQRAEELRPKAMALIEQARSVTDINRVRRVVRRWFDSNGRSPEVRLGLVGEIFMCVETFANQDIEKELARLGAEVLFERSLYHHLRHLLHIDASFLRSRRLARSYLRECPGGEALRTVGEAVHFARSGIDGILHIFPFTCMPENIALEALQQVSSDYGVPVLSLSFDEHTSTTGLVTRLEAFVDLVKRKKRDRRLRRN